MYITLLGGIFTTNHTQHYQLSQWDGADRVLRQDFNEDNAKIAAALEALQTGIDGAKSAAASGSSPETGNGVALLSPGYLNRFILLPHEGHQR